ncbi:SAVMC3_10250 family protein [Streptomyces sp. SL13]|uniref:SAVMC3_10250 family protein n=1 Tax=Streptantibioticus silvisoli TaxID=2705255 RepID=A0AA90HAT6_9ACTN|nr:SAVMC3_10250 family protein [Streptantibioticus silvisoli]MDI5974530.1 SAVMC3_10250 family protein [Streptantibioticus silvisoli]
MTDLVYVSERKLYGRLGLKPPSSQQGVQGAIKLPPVIEVSGTRSWDRSTTGLAPHAVVEKAKRLIDRERTVADFTDRGLRSNQWIHFDLDLAQVAVHEDSGAPPEDVALFVGNVPAGVRGQDREMGVLLCGSVQHVRTRSIPAGRMGSDTTWLHDLILEVERREEEGINVIPENITDILAFCPDEYRVEAAAYGVHGWAARGYPPRIRGRMSGHAIVLMDIDGPDWTHRLLVATPLYVETHPPAAPSSWVARLFGRGREAP